MPLTKFENRILKKIKVPSENDPGRPEFPPDRPKFPATPSFRINVPGFKNVWLKDESINKYSGTHKDRLAWEVIILYRDFLLAKKAGRFKGPLPQFSIISSGSAALAISRMLKDYGLPKLKTLVDIHLDPELHNALKKSGCEIFRTDLSRKALEPKEILKMTNNQDGFDLTSNQGVSLEIGNYDWMSYEIINLSPEYVFIPFGTGTIFKKLLEINKREVASPLHDRRFKGNRSVLMNCNFLAATSTNPKTKADKLYSPHLPFSLIDEDWIKFYKKAGYCGELTGIKIVHEEYLDKALELAKKQSIVCEASGIAGLALLLQLKNRVPKNKKVLIINTGKTKLN